MFDEYWQDQLRDAPDFASTIGDNRYATELPDDSPATRNARLERDAGLLERIGAADVNGVPQDFVQARELVMSELLREQEDSRFNAWQAPLRDAGGFPVELSELWQQLSFTTAQDYDDYIARMKQVPRVIEQQTDNMQAGADDGRFPPVGGLEAALAAIKSIAAKNGEASPFAGPLAEMPENITPKTRQRIHDALLDVVSGQVVPAYKRLARYLEVAYIPLAAARPAPDDADATPLEPLPAPGPPSQLKTQALALRDAARKQLGAKFSLHDFFAQVLATGILPFDEAEARERAFTAKSAVPPHP